MRKLQPFIALEKTADLLHHVTCISQSDVSSLSSSSINICCFLHGGGIYLNTPQSYYKFSIRIKSTNSNSFDVNIVHYYEAKRRLLSDIYGRNALRIWGFAKGKSRKCETVLKCFRFPKKNKSAMELLHRASELRIICCISF